MPAQTTPPAGSENAGTDLVAGNTPNDSADVNTPENSNVNPAQTESVRTPESNTESEDEKKKKPDEAENAK